MSKYYKIYFTFADFNPILAYLEIYTKNLTQIHSLGRYLLPTSHFWGSNKQVNLQKNQLQLRLKKKKNADNERNGKTASAES